MPTLYFFEREHSHAQTSLDWTLDWPWAFWSTDPNDTWHLDDIGEASESHRAYYRKPAIAFLGVSQEGVFMWLQLIGGHMFHIDIRCVHDSSSRFCDKIS